MVFRYVIFGCSFFAFRYSHLLQNPFMKTLLILASALLITPLSAQTAPRKFTPEDVLALRNVTDTQISPDGQWVAYVVTVADMKEDAFDSDVWLVATAGGAPVRLTSSKKADNSPRWSPDGKRIAFLSARDERAQIWIMSPFGGEPERLTEGKTAVQGFQWSPDGRRIAFVAQQELTADEEKKQKDKDDAIVVDHDFRFARLSVIDVESKRVTPLARTDMSVNDPQWSPDGVSLAFSSTPTPKADDGSVSDVWIVGTNGGMPRKLLENPGPDHSPRWSPDGKWIALLTRDGTGSSNRQTELAVIPASGGKPRVVTSTFIYQPQSPSWSRAGDTLYFTAQTRTASQLYAVPVAGGVPVARSQGHGALGWVTHSANHSTIAYTFGDMQHPSEVYTASLASMDHGARLTDHNDTGFGFRILPTVARVRQE